jgi:RNA polymerase subunit RPABC4/transcription elongation factor Spt4
LAKQEDDGVACPVCGKIVGVDVSSCPYCGAEFEHDEDEVGPSQAGKPVSSDEGEEVACPVCGVLVGLDVASCPKCGAEFEEEEIEEIIEVEEKTTVFEAEPEPAPVKARPAPKSKPRTAQKVRPRAAPREESTAGALPASILDLRVIGLALIILGIVGTQIALMIDWYWEWVPPIEDNLAMFVVIPVVLLVLGLVAFMVVKKAMAGGREMPSSMPGASLSLFLFGIIALIVVVLWDPINSALQDSQAAVAGGFAVALVVGILFLIMGSRSAAKRAACD